MIKHCSCRDLTVDLTISREILKLATTHIYKTLEKRLTQCDQKWREQARKGMEASSLLPSWYTIGVCHAGCWGRTVITS